MILECSLSELLKETKMKKKFKTIIAYNFVK